MNSHSSQKKCVQCFHFDFCPFGLIEVLQDWRLCCLEQTHCFFFIPPFLTFSYYRSAFHPAYLTTSVLKPGPNLLSGRRLYKWEEKAHCSSIIWHDIIWRPPKTDFWVNSWKYFQTGTNFWQKSDCMAGLEIFWLETFLERCCATDLGQSLFLSEIKSRDWSSYFLAGNVLRKMILDSRQSGDLGNYQLGKVWPSSRLSVE